MKRVLTIGMVILMGSIISLGITNIGNSNAKDKRNDRYEDWKKSNQDSYEYEYSLEENSEFSYGDIKENVTEEIIHQEETETETETLWVDVNFDILSYEVKASYEEYSLSNLPITDYYANGNSFEKLISNEYKIKVPYTTEDGARGVIKYGVNEIGELELQGQTLIGNTEHLYISPERVNNTINEKIKENVEKIIYTYSDRYNMTIVYVKTEDGEYVIPYTQERLENIDNDTVYTVENFFENLNTIFDENSLISAGMENGGVLYRRKCIEKDLLKIFLAIVSCIISLIWIIKLKKMSKSI